MEAEGTGFEKDCVGHRVRSGHGLRERDWETMRSLAVREGMGVLSQNHPGERTG